MPVMLVIPLVPLSTESRGPGQRVSLGGSLFVLLPDLDGLISFARDKTQTSTIKGRSHDTGFGLKRARLCGSFHRLEAVASLPIPEGHGTVVTTGEENVLVVDGERVDDRVLTVEVLHEIALGAHPLLDAAGTGTGKCKLGGVNGEVANTLLVVCQDAHALTGGQIPQPDCGI